MANAALFIGWGAPVVGRERQANRVFEEALQFFGGLQQQGEIAGFEPVQLHPHGGDLSGFLLIRGDSDQLNRMRDSDGFLRIVARAQLIVNNFGVVPANIGEELAKSFALYQEQLDDLA